MMKALILTTILLVIGFNDIAEINKLKKQAEVAYLEGEYETALSIYRKLADDPEVNNDEIMLNIANSLFQLGDSAATDAYYLLTISENKKISSRALNQLGVLAEAKNPKNALQLFKQALKADPGNDKARYNYEVLKKKLEEQKNQNQDQQKQDQQKDQDQQNQENQEGDQDQQKEGEEGESGEEKDQQQEQNQEDEGKEGDQEEGEQKEGEEGKEQQDGEEQGEKNDQQDQSGNEKQEEQGKEEQDNQEDGEKEGKDSQAGDKDEEAENKPGDPPKDGKTDEKKKALMKLKQAEMLLDAMNDKEIQFLQQQRKRSAKRRKSGQPDW